MFFANSSYYYILIPLNAICVIHCLRKGNANWWIWLIVFVPYVGSIAYLFMNVFSGNSIRKPKIDIVAMVNPGSKLKKLEDNLRFSDTFSNKVQLADAYLEAGFTDKAVDLYNNSLTGAFAENEHVLGQLVKGYFAQQRYPEAIAAAKKIYKTPQFARSKAHVLYAKALEFNGDADLAENEFKMMKARYAYFEQRYEYGLFLIRADRADDAARIFTEILEEAPHLSAMEKKSSRTWIVRSKEELRRLPVS